LLVDRGTALFDPTVGSEMQKTRPCVVISPDDMNGHLRAVIVAPMTTGSRRARFRIAFTSLRCGRPVDWRAELRA
jgi:mRNA-degrading endonuclease toxin of MazEF toxin-antitoxin module